jgi:PST family polysaccharide transporter
MGLLLVVNAFSFPSIIARKRMQFGGYTLLEGIALVVANVVGIVMAYAGLGVWSLVARLAVQRAVFAFAVWFIVDWRPVRPQFRGIGRLVRFGVHILGANICYYASQNMASLITGKFLGVETLGSLSIAFNLAVVPAQRIQSVLTTVLTPAFAKMNKSLEGLRTRIYKSLFTLGVLFIPMMLGLAAIGRGLVTTLYGEKWSDAGLFLSFLSLVGLTKGLEHMLRSAILARGGSSSIFRVTLVEALVSVPLLLAGAWFLGIGGVIAAYVFSSVLALALTVHAAQTCVDDRTIFLRATGGSFLAALVMGGAILAFGSLVAGAAGVTLPIQIALGCVLYTIVRVATLTAEERAMVRGWPVVGRLVRNA